MFSGSRCCPRVKAKQNCRSSFVVISDRPFLFIYPRWFRALPKTSDQSTTYEVSEGTRSSSLWDLPGRPPTETSGTDIPNHTSHAPRKLPHRTPKVSPTLDSHYVLESNLRAKRETLENIIGERRARQRLALGRRNVEFRHDGKYFHHHDSTSSVRPEQTIKSSKKIVSLDSSQWGKVVQLLVGSTPRHSLPEGEETCLSKQTLIVSSGTCEANSWIHQVRGGCRVEVTGQLSPTGLGRQVLLHGSPRAVALTKEHFVSLEAALLHQINDHRLGSNDVPRQVSISRGIPDRLQPDIFTGSHVGLKPASILPIRPVFARGKSSLQLETWKHADDMTHNGPKDVCSFLRAVEVLTTMRVPRLVKRELYGSRNQTHNSTIALRLCRLFTDLSTARFASTVALNTALSFLSKHGELFQETDLLYSQSRISRLRLQASTFSYVLLAMLSQNEVVRFGEVFHDLRAEGFTPDYKVWLAVLRHRSSLGLQSSIIEQMRHKGLMGSPFVKGLVAAEAASGELRHLDHDFVDPTSFIASVDARFGRDWMSQASVARVMEVCGETGAWRLALKVFDEATKRNVFFNTNAVSTVLMVMQQRGSLRDSLDFLQSHFARCVGRNDHAAIPIIFMTAWRHHFYNVCRVLWRYAAVRGVVSYKMQKVVTRSLLRNHSMGTTHAVAGGVTPSTWEWWRLAGKIVVGTDLDTRKFDTFFNLLCSPSVSRSKNPMVWLAQYMQDEGRDQQLSLAYVMLNRDLTAWKYFASPSSERLFGLLSAAYAMDVEWKGAGIGLAPGAKSIEWMIENAMSVRLVKREIRFPAKLRPDDEYVAEDHNP